MSSQAEITPLDLPNDKNYTHRAHRFPGKFHPPLIRSLINSNPDVRFVADPMCGSGTVGVESVIENKHFFGTDLDPLACLISRAKSTPVDPSDLKAVSKRILADVGKMQDTNGMSDEDVRELIESNLANTSYVAPYNLFHWFEPNVALCISDLLRATNWVLNIESEEMNDAIHMCIASIVRLNSRADPQPVSGLEVTSVRKEQLENGINFDVLKSFEKSVDRLANGYAEMIKSNQLGDSVIIEGNAKNFFDLVNEYGPRPDLIITSPPYCNAIDYPRRHRLENEWLGLYDGEDLNEVRKNRIEQSRDFFGSHQIRKKTLSELPPIQHPGVKEVTDLIEYEKKQPRKANMLRKYFLDAYDWLEGIHESLRDDGRFYMTIGPSTSYGQVIDTPSFIADIAKDVGFQLNSRHKYKLTNKKMQYDTNGPTIKTESLLEFEKL